MFNQRLDLPRVGVEVVEEKENVHGLKCVLSADLLVPMLESKSKQGVLCLLLNFCVSLSWHYELVS